MGGTSQRRPVRILVAIQTVLVVNLAQSAPGQSDPPFLDFRDALLSNSAAPNFNGPDRGGPDTLHGEGAGHWFSLYQPLDLSADPDDQWDPVTVPKWQDGTDFDIQPISPKLPLWTTDPNELGDPSHRDHVLNNGETIYDGVNPIMHVVPGRFLVGAIMWPHEEYVEKFVTGELTEITINEKRPIYWLAKYYLFIPADYGKDLDSDRRHRAIIMGGRGQEPGSQPITLPPWMHERLEQRETFAALTTPHTEENPNQSWMFHAAYRTARRLRVPVMLLIEYPELVNTWRSKSASPFYPQGGISGYTTESRVDFPTAWVAKADNADPIRDHPQFMYAATFVRARTFLDGFFNPVQRGTEAWSKWDDIVAFYDPTASDRFMSIDNVIAQGSSKRGHAVWLAGLADPCITAIVSNGMAHLRIPQSVRFAQDEEAEKRDITLPGRSGTIDPEFDVSGDLPGDPDQLPQTFTSRMQNSVDSIARGYRREDEKQAPYYDVYRLFVNRDLMKDSEHPGNPLDEIQVYNTQGAQDEFWPRMAWHYWFEEEVFHGSNQYLDWNMYGTHPPYHPEFAEKVQGFAEHVWFNRPMPTAEIWDIEYQEPPYYDPDSVSYVPVRVKAIFTIRDDPEWTTDPADSLNAFDLSLCIAVRPHHTRLSRGVWSDYIAGQEYSSDLGRYTPWWEIKHSPTGITPITAYPDGSPLPANSKGYEVQFVFGSNPYSQLMNPAVDPPKFFDPTAWANMTGVPEKCHVCLYVRAGVKHQRSREDAATGDDDLSWRVYASSPFEFLPAWWVAQPTINNHPGQ